MARRTLAALLLLPLLAFAPAAAAPITPQDLRRHVDILASDAFEGRAPGTAGEEKTTGYIVEQWQAIGLEPAGEAGGWFQKVPLLSRMPLTQRASWRGRKRILEGEESQLILIGSEAEARVEGRVIFAGWAAEVPMELEGAIVLAHYVSPPGVAPFDQRSAAFAARGAAAVIAIMPEEVPWAAVEQAMAHAQVSLDAAPRAKIAGIISHSAARAIYNVARADPEKLAPSTPRLLRLRGALETTGVVRRFTSNNVIGRLRGTGASGESLLYLGHWDHLGICAAEGEADRICNGAVDNASGIAMLIEVARGLATRPRPARDVLFLATTAEETGLLGAEYFAKHPVVPASSIVAAINADTVAIAPKGEKVAVIGRGVEAIDRIVAQTVREAGRTLDEDGEADSFAPRQDGWALAKVGIPALMVGGSFSDMGRLQAFLGGAYHKASDNPGPQVMLDGAAEDADLLVALGRKLADPAAYRRADSLARP
jgi:hypothetical protein